jgi:hypothetical protein
VKKLTDDELVSMALTAIEQLTGKSPKKLTIAQIHQQMNLGVESEDQVKKGELPPVLVTLVLQKKITRHEGRTITFELAPSSPQKTEKDPPVADTPKNGDKKELPSDFGYLVIRLMQSRVVLHEKDLVEQAEAEKCDLDFSWGSLTAEVHTSEDKFRQRVTTIDAVLKKAGLLEDFNTCMDLARAITKSSEEKLLAVCNGDEQDAKQLKQMEASDFLLDIEMEKVRTLLAKIKPPRLNPQARIERVKKTLPSNVFASPPTAGTTAGPKPAVMAGGSPSNPDLTGGAKAPAETTANSDRQQEEIVKLEKEKSDLKGEITTLTTNRDQLQGQLKCAVGTIQLFAEEAEQGTSAVSAAKPPVSAGTPLSDPQPVASSQPSGKNKSKRSLRTTIALCVGAAAIVIGIAIGIASFTSGVSPEIQASLDAAKRLNQPSQAQ